MGVTSNEDQEILINSLNYFPTPTAPPENTFTPSAPFLDEFECIVCMEEQVIIFNFIILLKCIILKLILTLVCVFCITFWCLLFVQ